MIQIEVRKEEQVVGIINNKYPIQVNYKGSELLPDIGVDYIYFKWNDQPWFENFYLDKNNSVNSFTPEQELFIRRLCANWIQPLGQEGNPTIEQAKVKTKSELLIAFNKDTTELSNMTSIHEMSSWSIQIEEAKSFTLDNNNNTPFIDDLLISRDLNETKLELVEKIINNYNTYNSQYAKLLGKYYKLLNSLNNASTYEEINIIKW